MVRHAPSSNSRAYALLGGAADDRDHLPPARLSLGTHHGRRAPAAVADLPDPGDETTTAITQIVWSDHPVVRLLAARALGARRFLRQDRAMVDLQKQGLTHDPPLLWIDDADRQAKWYQALKREWRESRRAGRPFQNPVLPATLRWKS